MKPSVESTSAVKEVSIEEINGSWRVVPGIREVTPGDSVTIELKGGRAAYVHFLDPTLYKGMPIRVVVYADGESFMIMDEDSVDVRLVVQDNPHPGPYPYAVIVKDDRGKLHVAEGNSMPEFWVDH